MEATPVAHNAKGYRGFALAQLRILSDYCKRYKLNIASRKVVLNNGVVITCSYCWGKQDVWINIPASASPTRKQQIITCTLYSGMALGINLPHTFNDPNGFMPGITVTSYDGNNPVTHAATVFESLGADNTAIVAYFNEYAAFYGVGVDTYSNYQIDYTPAQLDAIDEAQAAGLPAPVFPVESRAVSVWFIDQSKPIKDTTRYKVFYFIPNINSACVYLSAVQRIIDVPPGTDLPDGYHKPYLPPDPVDPPSGVRAPVLIDSGTKDINNFGSVRYNTRQTMGLEEYTSLHGAIADGSVVTYTASDNSIFTASRTGGVVTVEVFAKKWVAESQPPTAKYVVVRGQFISMAQLSTVINGSLGASVRFVVNGDLEYCVAAYTLNYSSSGTYEKWYRFGLVSGVYPDITIDHTRPSESYDYIESWGMQMSTPYEVWQVLFSSRIALNHIVTESSDFWSAVDSSPGTVPSDLESAYLPYGNVGGGYYPLDGFIWFHDPDEFYGA